MEEEEDQLLAELKTRSSTSVVFEGEVVVVGDFWRKTEGEVLPVSHLVFVHGADPFDDLRGNHRSALVCSHNTHPFKSFI